MWNGPKVATSSIIFSRYSPQRLFPITKLKKRPERKRWWNRHLNRCLFWRHRQIVLLGNSQKIGEIWTKYMGLKGDNVEKLNIFLLTKNMRRRSLSKFLPSKLQCHIISWDSSSLTLTKKLCSVINYLMMFRVDLMNIN